MMRTAKNSTLLLLATAVFVFAAAPTYKVVNKIKIGGGGRWDYSYSDSANHRLYISHGTQVDVVDTATDKTVGAIMGANNIHGIAVANDLGKGFISDGGNNNVMVFDLKTLAVTSKINTGQNPDSIIYEPVTHLIYTFNGRSSDATAIDAKAGTVVAASIPVGGKPEFAQVDGKGHIYANIEDKNEIIDINAKDKLVARRYSIAPCDSPSGLATDAKGRLYSVCENKLMIVSDPVAGKVLASVPIGAGDDGVAFDDGYAFAANGTDGTVTMVGETSPGKFEAVATITTQRSARTIASDQKTHKLYLPAAEFGPATTGKDGKKARPQALPDSFSIVVLGR
jgi:YVTN family beta-propeller protein